jgi:hypothetical protein
MRRIPLAALLLLIVPGLAGCHSAFIDATVSNRTAKPVTLVEVDYPSASFGTQTLAPGQDFHYRFKVLGSGPVKLLYTDTANTEQHSTGPDLSESDEGKLTIVITPTGPTWTPQFKPVH